MKDSYFNLCIGRNNKINRIKIDLYILYQVPHILDRDLLKTYLTKVPFSQ